MRTSMHVFTQDIEVGCPVRGRPSYRWVNGYFEVTSTGTLYPGMTLKEARTLARETNRILVVHETKEAALRSMENSHEQNSEAAKREDENRHSDRPCVP